MGKKWTLESLQEEALKYRSRSEFEKNNLSAYNAARRYGVLEIICSHMTLLWEKKWDFKALETEALKYNSKSEFQKNSSAYQAARYYGIIDKICGHMEKKRRFWTVNSITAEALRYNSRYEFRKNSLAYRAAEKRHILDTVCSHMKDGRKVWTLKSVFSEAKKHSKKLEFQKKSPGAYDFAQRYEIIDQICSHMLPATNTSTSEKGLFTIIKELFPKAQKLVDRKVNIPNKSHIKGFDIDIYVPELRKGIEFDGIYYHSFSGLKRGRPNWPKEDLENYHQIKDEYFRNKSIELLHINEKDWIKNPEEEIKKCLEFLNKENL